MFDGTIITYVAILNYQRVSKETWGTYFNVFHVCQEKNPWWFVNIRSMSVVILFGLYDYLPLLKMMGIPLTKKIWDWPGDNWVCSEEKCSLRKIGNYQETRILNHRNWRLNQWSLELECTISLSMRQLCCPWQSAVHHHLVKKKHVGKLIIPREVRPHYGTMTMEPSWNFHVHSWYLCIASLEYVCWHFSIKPII